MLFIAAYYYYYYAIIIMLCSVVQCIGTIILMYVCCSIRSTSAWLPD